MRAIMRFFCLVFGMAALWATTSGAATAANGCSIYSNYGDNSGKTWFNEHYYGSTVDHFLEVFSRNPQVTASNPSIWSKWYIRLYGKNNVVHTFPLSESTTACTTNGGRTYITYQKEKLNLNFNDAMIVVFDGPPDLSSTKEIDAYMYGNSIPPKPYIDNYYRPTCSALADSIDWQVFFAIISGLFTNTYSGQNILILPNFNNKDNSRIPDGTGKWEETSDGGSGTTFTQCVTNDPVDIVKSFTWAPKYTEPTYSGTVDPGAVVRFTVTAKNNTKASMAGVKIRDALPGGLTLSGTPTATGGASVSCTGGTCLLTAPASLLAGDTISMTFDAKVTAGPGSTIRNEAVQTGGTTYDPPPMAEAFITVGSGPAPAGSFNACHNFDAADAFSCSNLNPNPKARLYTRLASAAFTTDIVALKTDGTVYRDFVGAGGEARTVKVELIDQENGSTVATTDATFLANDITGRAVASWPVLNKAYSKLQVRITDSSGATPVSAVSSDSFAVRPSAVSISSTNASAPVPGGATPVRTGTTHKIKAGTAFTIEATTTPATGYAGTLVLDTAKLNGTAALGKLNAVSTNTELTALQANTSASNNASYDEVGYLDADKGAFRDDAFTAVDQNGDCISSTTDGHHLSDELVNGKYGCSIGNKTPISFGRFTPHHFQVSATLTNRSDLTSCASSFTYMGEPMRLTLTVTAKNEDDGTTKNYAGGFVRLDGSTPEKWLNDPKDEGIGLGAVDGTISPLTTRLMVSSISPSTWDAGVGTLPANVVVKRADNPDGPFENLKLGVAPKDLDLVTVLPTALDLDVDLATPANKEHQEVAATSIRYGRARLSNAHGSEQLPLPVPFLTEFYRTGTGWVTNLDDSCTQVPVPVPPPVLIPPPDSGLLFAAGTLKNQLSAGEVIARMRDSSGTSIDTGNGFFKNGNGQLRLTHPTALNSGPGTGNYGYVIVTPEVPDWLKFKWNGTVDTNPSARATFGVYRGSPVIYLREIY